MIYAPVWEGGQYAMGAFALSGIGARNEGRLRERFDSHIRATSDVWSLYDPAAVSKEQRNRVVAGHHRQAMEGVLGRIGRGLAADEQSRRASLFAKARDGFETWGTLDATAHRVLVCDGPRLLAWVGAVQHDPFASRRARLLQALAGPMQRRFVLEERLGVPTQHTGLVPALLDQIPGPAYLVNRKRRVVACNAVGARRLAGDPRRAQRFASSAMGHPDATVIDLSIRGVPNHQLVLERDVQELPSGFTLLATRYRLTRRELEVLSHLGQGRSNRAIAAALGCGERTVETHVSRVLEKTDCASRAELVALAWRCGSAPA